MSASERGSRKGAGLEEERGQSHRRGGSRVKGWEGQDPTMVRGWIPRGRTWSAGGGTGPDRSCGNSRVGQDGVDSESGRKRPSS